MPRSPEKSDKEELSTTVGKLDGSDSEASSKRSRKQSSSMEKASPESAKAESGYDEVTTL
eukprot:gene2534-729_t